MTTAVATHVGLFDITTAVAPAEEPVSLTEAKEYLRVEDTAQDAQVTALIIGARMWAEGHTRRAFVDRDLVVKLTQVPPGTRPIYLPYPRVSVLTGISYEDENGDTQVLDVLDFTLEPMDGIVYPDVGTEWPVSRSMTFEYTAGYGDAAAVPELVKVGIKIALSTMWENRVDQFVGTIISTPQAKASMAVLNQYRVFEF